MLFWHVSNNPDICWNIAVSIISYIFDLPEIWLSVWSQIQLWNHIVFYYLGSQFSITFGIKSTLITFCLCMKLIISHYRYEWCLMLYISYGCCFFEGHLRWFNRWPVCICFHKAYNLLNLIWKRGSSEGDWFPDWSKRFSQGSGRRKWSAPCWLGPGRSPGFVTLEKISLHSL